MRIHWGRNVCEPLDVRIVDTRDRVERDPGGELWDVHQVKLEGPSGIELVVSVATHQKKLNHETVVYIRNEEDQFWRSVKRMGGKYTVPVAIKRAFPEGVR